MTTYDCYDWIVVGNGIAGAALSYELKKVGFSVLLLDQSVSPQSATRYSYGGIAYWSGTTGWMRQLCQEGIALHRQLSDELAGDTQFRDIDLLLTIAPERDPAEVAATYAKFAIQPQLLEVTDACTLEPLLNPSAISAALCLPHGHVSPEGMVAAYNQAFRRLGGVIQIAGVTGWVQQEGKIQGVVTSEALYPAARVAVSSGAMTRTLLQSIGLSIRQCFTQAELMESLPVELKLRTLIMPAELQRFEMEAKAGAAAVDHLWDQPGHEVVPAVLDVGMVQFQDGSLRLGQVSRTLTDPVAKVDARASEASLRDAVSFLLPALLPALQTVPVTWHQCLVAFSGDRLPLVGAVPNADGIYAFTAFSNPFAILPPLARRFAEAVQQADIESGELPDPILIQLAPARFDRAPVPD